MKRRLKYLAQIRQGSEKTVSSPFGIPVPLWLIKRIDDGLQSGWFLDINRGYASCGDEEYTYHRLHDDLHSGGDVE